MSLSKPDNPNFLHPNKFQLRFARLPDTQFTCQDINIPGISTKSYPRDTPFVDLYSPGDKLYYDPLVVNFLVDEEMNTWKEIHDWIRAMVFPTDFSEYRELSRMALKNLREEFPQFSDATLTVLSSSNNPQFIYKFIEIYPESLDSIALSTTKSPDDVLTATAIFRYSYFNVELVR